MALRIFVTGATGYLGSAIVARLAHAGHDVLGLTRRPASARAIGAAGARPVIGDLADPSSFLPDLKNCDVAIHAAVDHTDVTARDQQALEAFRAAAEDGRVRRLLYTSGLWDYGAAGSNLVDETAPLQPIARVKWRAAHQDVAFDLGELGVAVSVLTPGIAYGGHGGILGDWWAEAREHGTVTYPGDGTQHWPIVHRDDIAAAYTLAAEHARGGERYLIVDESQFTVRELAEAVAGASGAATRPRPAAELIAELGDYGEALLCDQRLTAAKARRELGWVPRHGSFVAAADDLHREWQAGLRAPVA